MKSEDRGNIGPMALPPNRQEEDVNFFLSRLEKLLHNLSERIKVLPKVDEKGDSECPFAESLYFDKHEAAKELRHAVEKLSGYLNWVEEQIARCRKNENLIDTDRTSLNSLEAREKYDHAKKSQELELRKYLYLKKSMLRLKAEAKALLAQADKKKWPLGVPQAGAGSSPEDILEAVMNRRLPVLQPQPARPIYHWPSSDSPHPWASQQPILRGGIRPPTEWPSPAYGPGYSGQSPADTEDQGPSAAQERRESSDLDAGWRSSQAMQSVAVAPGVPSPSHPAWGPAAEVADDDIGTSDIPSSTSQGGPSHQGMEGGRPSMQPPSESSLGAMDFMSDSQSVGNRLPIVDPAAPGTTEHNVSISASEQAGPGVQRMSPAPTASTDPLPGSFSEGPETVPSNSCLVFGSLDLAMPPAPITPGPLPDPMAPVPSLPDEVNSLMTLGPVDGPQ